MDISPSPSFEAKREYRDLHKIGKDEKVLNVTNNMKAACARVIASRAMSVHYRVSLTSILLQAPGNDGGLMSSVIFEMIKFGRFYLEKPSV
ncbi:hypothetical protein AAMO2058_000250300 [Amorphochlora amoebiformis]